MQDKDASLTRPSRPLNQPSPLAAQKCGTLTYRGRMKHMSDNNMREEECVQGFIIKLCLASCCCHNQAISNLGCALKPK